MPKYSYSCRTCNVTLEIRHPYKEKVVVCKDCGKSSLEKLLDTPITTTSTNIIPVDTPVGSVINKTIDELKREIQEEKNRLKERINKK